MTLTKIHESDDVKQAFCNDSLHRPPMHAVVEPGLYQWKCPTCANVMQFRVTQPVMVRDGVAHRDRFIVGTNR